MKQIIQLTFTVTALALGLLAPGLAAANVSEQTLKNLNAAFQGESNAAHRYAAFAAKASADGYPQVAKLFRAATAAEGITRCWRRRAASNSSGRSLPS